MNDSTFYVKPNTGSKGETCHLDNRKEIMCRESHDLPITVS